MALFDINCHLLPKIGGGPESLEESVQMANRAAGSGVVGIVATADQIDVLDSLGIEGMRREMNSVRRAIQRTEHGTANHILLRLGMENHVSRNLAALFDAGEALAIEETRFFLVRLPFNHYPDYADSVLDQLKVWRLQPILAHPERNTRMQRDWKRLRDLVERHSFVQISAGSLLGTFGTAARNTAEQLISRGIAHTVASEMRSSEGQLGTPLADTYPILREMAGNQIATQLLEVNPSRIFSGVPPRPLASEIIENASRSRARNFIIRS